MAVNRLQYAKELEKQLSQGVSFEKADEMARNKSTVKPKKRSSRKSLAKTIVRKAKEVWYGPETYLHETPQQRRERVRKK